MKAGKARTECPECGGVLREVYSEANYGRVLLLDQCGACAGVWFDRWELLFATDKALDGLHEMDAWSLLARPPAEKGGGLCPACGQSLLLFEDANLPKDALISRCPGCAGLWLNRGELKRYAGHRRSLRPGRRAASGSAQIETLKRLQKELRPGELAMPTTHELASRLDGQAPELTTREVAKDLAFLALQSFLRLAFKV